MPDASFLTAAAVVLSVWAVVLWRVGPNAALGAAVLVASLFPTWVKTSMLGLPVDCRTFVAGIGLLWICVDRRGRIRSPIVLLDLLVAGLVVWQFLSDSRADGLAASHAVRSYGEWAFPYLAGRLALRSSVETASVTPWGAATLAVLGLLTLVEPVLRANPYDVIFGPPGDAEFPRDVMRYGVKRAMGPTEHPIFLGAVLLLLMPWAVSLWQSRQKRGLAAAALVLGMAGILATLSRGPVMGLMIAAVTLTAVRWPKLRWPVGVVGGLLMATVLVFPTKTALALSRLTNEDRQRTDVEIGGVRYEMSGTLQRVQLVRAYWPAFRSAGPLGYGTRKVKGFPPKVPNLPENRRTREMLRIVDNSYLLLGLRLGWVGAGLLLAILITAAVSALRLADDRTLLGLPGAMGSVLVAMIPLLLTVYLAYEFAFELIAVCGFAGSLASADKASRIGRPLT